jgi:hypothetical protein
MNASNHSLLSDPESGIVEKIRRYRFFDSVEEQLKNTSWPSRIRPLGSNSSRIRSGFAPHARQRSVSGYGEFADGHAKQPT